MAVRAFGKMTQIQKRIFIKGFPLFTWWKLLFFFKDTSKYDPSTCILQNLHLSHKSCVCVRILAGFFLKIYTFVLFFIDVLFGNHMVCYWWKQFFCHQEKIEQGTGAHSNLKCGQYFMTHFLQLIDGLLLCFEK